MSINDSSPPPVPAGGAVVGELVGAVEAEAEETDAEETAEPADHVNRPIHRGPHLERGTYLK